MKKVIQYMIQAVCVLGMLFAGVAAFSAFHYSRQTWYIKNFTEYKTLVLAVMTLLFGAFMILAFRKIDTAKQQRLKIVFGILAVLMLIVQIALTVSIPVTFTSDHFRSHVYAYQLATGAATEIDTINDAYWSMFGNLYFFVAFLKVLYQVLVFIGIKDIALASIILNIFLLDLGVFFTFRIAKLIRNERFAYKVLLLCMLNPMFYTETFWVYSSMLSIVFLMGVLYYAIRLWKGIRQNTDFKKSILDCFFFTFCLVVGGFLRPTTYIALIAMIICVLFYGAVKVCSEKDEKRGYIKQMLYKTAPRAVLVLVLCMMLQVVCQTEVDKIAKDTSKNYPATHWIMMGVQGSGRVTIDAQEYTRSFETKEEKVKGNLAAVKEAVKEKGVSGMTQLFLSKMKTTWGDGIDITYCRIKQEYGDRAWVYDYIAGSKMDIFIWYGQTYRCFSLLFLLAAFISLFRRKENNSFFMLGLTMVGAFAFYLMWEAKTDYNLQFLIIISLLTCMGVEESPFYNLKVSRFIGKAVLYGVLVVTGFALLVHIKDYTKTKYDFRDYVAEYENNIFVQWVNPVLNEPVRQEFVTEKPISELSFMVRKDENQDVKEEYVVRLYNEKQELLLEKNISSDDVKNDRLNVFFKRIKTEGKQKYTIELTKLSDTKRMVFFIRDKQRPVLEDSSLTFAGETTEERTLMFSACNKVKKPYTTRYGYAMISILMLISEAWILRSYLGLRRNNSL